MSRFGLYLHWPFCQSKCPYCDFNSHVSAQIDPDAWLAAYQSEIARVSRETGPRTLNTIYFGGGTPSLMPAKLVDGILTAIRAAWPMANDVEITLEANPTSVEAGRFHDYRQSGVNRVSLGIQALNDTDLRALGRLHSVDEALRALEIARNTFDRVTFDLIYARQNQSLDDWQAELARALSFDPSHLSMYQLTIEPGTAFGDRFSRGGLRGLPDEDLGADMYFLTQDMTEAAGLPAYEVSNHARPGQESQHNMIYWTGADYAGIGPGAHGRLTLDGQRFATETELSPLNWLANVKNNGSGETLRGRLSAVDQAGERLMMGLRIREGLPMKNVVALVNDDFTNKINELSGYGLIQVEDDTLTVTDQGRPVLNAIVRELLP